MEKKEIEALVREVLRTVEQKAEFPAPGGSAAGRRENPAALAGTGSFPGILAEGSGGMVQTTMPLSQILWS